jgi:hypothetical protein
LDERSELETLVKTLKKKLEKVTNATPSVNVSPNKRQMSIAPSNLDINELRRRGL